MLSIFRIDVCASNETHKVEVKLQNSKPKLGLRLGGFKPPTKQNPSHGHLMAPCDKEPRPPHQNPTSAVESCTTENDHGSKYYSVMW